MEVLNSDCCDLSRKFTPSVGEAPSVFAVTTENGGKGNLQ